MKPEFQISILLGFLAALAAPRISVDLRAEAAMGEEAPGKSVHQIQITKTGWLHLTWKDPSDQSGLSEITTWLVDSDGKTDILDLSRMKLTSNELLRLNRHWIAVQGFLDSSKRDLSPGVVHVTQIETPGGVPLVVPTVLGNKKFVTILCKFELISTEPKTLSFFENMYQDAFPGLDHYWQELSYGKVWLTGSDALGWYTLDHPRSYYVYNMDADPEDEADLTRLVNDCTAEANNDVNFPDFFGILMMFNSELDGFSYGGSWSLSHDGQTKDYAIGWLADWGYTDISVVEHEMGHGFGLPHSSGMYGYTYDNYYDVMSWDRQTGYQDPVYGRTGQHTIAYHKDLLGWIDAADIITILNDSSVQTIYLSPHANDDYAYPKLARLPVKNSSRFYTLERRQGNTGYDTNIYSTGVIIHEVDPAREAPAHVVDYDNNRDTSDDGTRWTSLPNHPETFIDATDGISVTIVAEFSSHYVVRVKVGDPFPFVNCNSQNQMPLSSCQALTALYEQAGGLNWERSDYWMSSEWPCRWLGITCPNMYGDVITINLPENDMTGTLPAELGGLVSVLGINMRNNHLSGPIPEEMGDITTLQMLELGSNDLTGTLPSTMGSLSSLVGLYLDDNQLEGSIPTSLENLDALQYLDLEINKLSGSIPPEIGDMDSLVYLILDRNQLSGQIPSQLGNLDTLQVLQLWSNQLSGGIPTSFGGLSNLETFYIQNNCLTDPLPEVLFNLPELDDLDVSWNAIGGELPSNLGNQDELSRLLMQFNLFLGEIPDNFENLTSLFYLDLGFNALTASDGALASFVTSKDSDWVLTQTMPPANLQAEKVGDDIQLSWTPRGFTSGNGYYEISAALTPGGPFTVLGNTVDKTISGYLAVGYASPVHSFRVRTRSYHYNCGMEYDRWSDYTPVVAGGMLEIFLPVVVK